MRVWMALDPETRRVTMQDREFGDGDLPPGLRGLDWPKRQADIDEEAWQGILAGTLTGDEVNQIHRSAWTENGDTPWPSL